MDTVTSFLTALAPILTGPAGGLITVILILAGGTYVFVKFMMPLIYDWFEKQDKRFHDALQAHNDDRVVFEKAVNQIMIGVEATKIKFQEILDEHHQDRAVFERTISQLVSGLEKTTTRVATMEKAVDALDKKVERLVDNDAHVN